MVAAAQYDPTLESLRRFDDPGLWKIIPNVPIFDEHDEYGKDGKITRRFDQRKLQEIVTKTERLERESGVIPKITIGHTLTTNAKTGQQPRETDQPPIVGYARQLHLGRFGPRKKLGILATFYFRRDQWQEAREYPYRSVEIYPTTNEITGIAILKRDPQLDLGLLTYSRDARGNEQLFYTMEGKMPETKIPGQPPAVPDPLEPDEKEHEKFMRMLHKHPAVQYMVKKYMEETGDKEMEGHAKYMSGSPAAMWAQVDDVDAHDKDKAGNSHYDKNRMKDDWHTNYQGAPAATNTFTPGDKSKPAEAQRMQRDQDAIRYSRMERELEQIKAENQASQLRYQRAERERELIQLEAEGFEFNRTELIDDVAALPQEQYVKRVQFIRQYGRQCPVGTSFIRTPPLGDAGHSVKKTTSEAQRNQAVSLATRKGLTYDEALAEVTKN